MAGVHPRPPDEGRVVSASGERRVSTAARGYRRPSDAGCYRRIVISLDDETFEAVVAMASKRSRSFAAVARELIEFGLLDVKAEA